MDATCVFGAICYNVDQVEKGMRSKGTLLNHSNEAYIQDGVYNIYAHTTIHTHVT